MNTMLEALARAMISRRAAAALRTYSGTELSARHTPPRADVREQGMQYRGKYRDATTLLHISPTGCALQLTRGALSAMRPLPLNTPVAELDRVAEALYLALAPRKGVGDE